MKKLVMSVAACLVITALYAGNNDSIVVKRDPRMDLLAQKQAQVNKRTAMLTSNGQYKGYRVQVISTNSREQAFKIKAELLTRFSDQKTYTIYQSPLFKVRIGNFLRREDADKYRKLLNKVYPQGVYVVEDVIEYNPSEEEELF
ncbi:MAG: SPOR domain-containing protein [Chitinophagaceae bacterium]|jgi:hypothetical protein|nr:SPOR domain-containing protein [Chitinophagaceae bacterium]